MGIKGLNDSKPLPIVFLITFLISHEIFLMNFLLHIILAIIFARFFRIKNTNVRLNLEFSLGEHQTSRG